MYVLGIETSCDETGIAIYGKNNGLVANQIYSQTELHSNYGGIVPELASRDHIVRIIPLIQKALRESKLSPKDISGIAYTAGPGLIGALMVGATVGCALAYAWQIPAIAIHHMEGHLLTPMWENNIFSPQLPFLGLLVSGAHTQLVEVKNIGEYKLLGESIDDAAGEVFDKVAKLLGLKYPGGALLSQLAKQGQTGRYTFPRPMINQPGLSFSFSGLKTAVANTIRINKNNPNMKADIARAFEDTMIEIIMIKCRRALLATNLRRLVVSGGVSANCNLRKKLNEMISQLQGQAFYPSLKFCTDNGAMIAYVGMLRLKQNIDKTNLIISVKPRWSLEELSIL